MGSLFLSLLGALRSALRTRADLVIENLALRQQLANFQRTSGRPRLRKGDRAFWLVLSRIWSRWADALVVVKPDTVARWHRAGFRWFWGWKSRARGSAQGDISPEVKQLICQMAKANPLWGAPKIHGEILKLGINISERSVSRFMPPKPRKPPSQTWRTFLDNHLGSLDSIVSPAASEGPTFTSITGDQGPTRWRGDGSSRCPLARGWRRASATTVAAARG